MASHLSDIGFRVEESSDWNDLIKRVLMNGQRFEHAAGAYVRWSPGDGVELWAQLDEGGHVVGLNPHFQGDGRMRFGVLELRPGKPGTLDGTLSGWANPPGANPAEGDYPLLIDLPDADLAPTRLAKPRVVDVQVAAFAHELTCFPDEAAYDTSQSREPRFAPESLVPTGLFTKDDPRAEAVFTGRVLRSELRTNPATGNVFHVLLVRTFGGVLDVVADPRIVSGEPVVGGLVRCQAWLSGRILSESTEVKSTVSEAPLESGPCSPAVDDRLEALFLSLRERRRPEDVAQVVLECLGSRLSHQERAMLQRAARGSLKQKVLGYTSMLEEFVRPVGLARQVITARALFKTAPALGNADAEDPDAVEGFIHRISPEIRKAFGKSDFLTDRLDRGSRKAQGLDLSKRQYNKRFRLLVRMEQKLMTLVREIRKRRFQMVGKSGLASTITREAFLADADTACFVAYYTARSNLRSEFTISGQQRPYDEIADTLFARCRRSETTNWWAIAHVYPSQEVLSHLSDQQKGELLGAWTSLLRNIAELLHETWDRSHFDRRTMIVQRGNDSSTWNNTARAWNTARQHWIALLHALGMDDVLDAMCPGKVLGLMAADVAAWHRLAGGGLHPDTFVWTDLPLPWKVLAGEAACPRSLVEKACAKHRVDPIKGGWSAPRPTGKVARFRPTPELVHGVTVADPILATILRKAGYFSGKFTGYENPPEQARR